MAFVCFIYTLAQFSWISYLWGRTKLRNQFISLDFSQHLKQFIFQVEYFFYVYLLHHAHNYTFLLIYNGV